MADATPSLIPIAKPLVGEAEAEAAAMAVRSGWLTQGAKVTEFERKIADYLGAKYAIACSSCTTALHLALLVADIGPGAEVIVPSMSFIATANSVRYVGATPVFAEVDPKTFNLDPDSTAAVITSRTRAILPVHQIGLPCDLDRFRALANRHGLTLIEDAACAIGSKVRGRFVGGDSLLACFSFHPRKVITTGEGGLITTHSESLANRLRLLRQHAMSLSDHLRHSATQVLIEEYTETGYNYRMTDIQAAIGLEQFKRLPGILARRKELADRYTIHLSPIQGIETPFIPDWATPNYQSYAIRLNSDFPLNRNDLMSALLSQGISTRRGIMTIHRETPYRGENRNPLPMTEAASDNSILLPLYPQMTDAEQDRVIHTLKEIASKGHEYTRAA